MILMLRVDHRVLHGQIAYSWTNYLNANCILIANDGIMKDELKKTAIYMAKPPSTKLVMKDIENSIKAINSGVTNQYRLLIIVETVEDAYRLLEGCENIRKINLGNSKVKDGGKQLAKTFYVLPEEEKQLQQMLGRGVEIFIQRVPEVKAIPYLK